MRTRPRDILVARQSARKERARRITRNLPELSTAAVDEVFQQVKEGKDRIVLIAPAKHDMLAQVHFVCCDEDDVATLYIYENGACSTHIAIVYGVAPVDTLAVLERLQVMIEALSLKWER